MRLAFPAPSRTRALAPEQKPPRRGGFCVSDGSDDEGPAGYFLPFFFGAAFFAFGAGLPAPATFEGLPSEATSAK